MIDYRLIENPNFVFWKRLAQKLKPETRKKFKEAKLPFILDIFRWLLIDLQRPRLFHPYGLDFLTGLPGSGKTIFLTSILNNYRERFGDSIYIATNYKYKYEDFPINSYKDLIKIYDKPTIVGYDEIQNDFDSRQWGEMDHAFSERITQSRKINGMKIIGTAQKFGFVDKRLRALTNLVIDCRMLGSRLTIGRAYSPEMKEKVENGQYNNIESVKTLGVRFLIQSDWLRNSYDSYQILQTISDKLNREPTKPELLVQTLKDILKTEPQEQR